MFRSQSTIEKNGGSGCINIKGGTGCVRVSGMNIMFRPITLQIDQACHQSGDEISVIIIQEILI